MLVRQRVKSVSSRESSIQPYKDAPFSLISTLSSLCRRYKEQCLLSASYTSHRLSRAVSAVLNNTSSLCLPLLPSFYPVRCLRYPLLASHPLFLITHQVIVSSTDHNNIVLPHYTLSTPTHSQATSNNTPPHPVARPSFPSCVFLKGNLANTQDAYGDNVIVCYIHGFEGQLCEYVKG